MLELRPGCECCDRDLPPDSTEARVCSFECTFCRTCAEDVLHGRCPNCGGERPQAGGLPRVTPARVLHVDAFASRPGMGNPAGVRLDADGIADAELQAIARAVGFNETAFVLPSRRAD